MQELHYHILIRFIVISLASKNIFDATSAMVKKRSSSELEQSSSRMDTRDSTGASRIQHNFSKDIALSSGEEMYEDEIYKDRCANDVDYDYNPSDMSDEYYEEDYEPSMLTTLSELYQIHKSISLSPLLTLWFIFVKNMYISILSAPISISTRKV